jgi:hypothetical protein
MVKNFLVGEERGIKKSILGVWKQWVDSEVSRIKQAQRLTGALPMLQKYALCFADTDPHLLQAAAFHVWHQSAREASSAGQKKDWETRLEEQKAHQLAQNARRKAVAASTCQTIGFHKNKLVLEQAWYAWSFSYRSTQEAARHKKNGARVLEMYSEVVLLSAVKGEGEALMAFCFRSWSGEAKLGCHLRAKISLETHASDAVLRSKALQQRVGELEEELLHAYSQIDHIAEALHTEMRGKEELAAELRAAFARVRQGTFSRPLSPDAMPHAQGSQLEPGSVTGSTTTPGSPEAFRQSGFLRRSGNGASKGSLSDFPGSRSHSPAYSLPRGRPLVSQLALQAPSSTSDALFNRVDLNHDGIITREEFDLARRDGKVICPVGSMPESFAQAPRALGSPHVMSSDMGTLPAAHFPISGPGTASDGDVRRTRTGVPPSSTYKARAWSPPRCDWNSVVEQMREEGILKQASALKD